MALVKKVRKVKKVSDQVQRRDGRETIQSIDRSKRTWTTTKGEPSRTE